MSATIHQLPDVPTRTWLPIGNALQAHILRRTNSVPITEAVEARCREVFERSTRRVLIPAGATQEDICNEIHTLIGNFVSEVAELALELEVLKQQRGEV